LRVRDATDADLDRLADIKVRNWRDTYSSLVPSDVLMPYLDHAAQLDYLREDAARPDALLLVVEGGVDGVIGFGLTFTAAQPDPWLESLHVLREFRSRGAGAALVRATATRLRALGHHTMRLGVVAGNRDAMRFYERLGAEHTGYEPALWAPGVRHEVYRWSDIAPLTDSLT
jgi:GNAT superfamily N-acetyltransferase